MEKQELELMAHLLRRAGFGATRDELETYVAKGYEPTVEALLHPDDPSNLPDDILMRYHQDMAEMRLMDAATGYWLYRMITTRCPLEEKLSLFWHSLFATGYTKLNQARSLLNQIDMFRHQGFGKLDNLLVELSKDPAMLFWLDNNDNHKEAINENYGRELLELFSMGVGNYTEDDVKACARAFTGWTMANTEYMAVRANKDSVWPYGRIAWHFQYKSEDHDDCEKTFLGETGRLNGEDVIDIIVRRPETARFISTRLFQFFAADKVDDQGKHVIETMMQSYFDSGYEIRSVLRTLFNSAYFKGKAARFARVKGPVEQIVGAVHLAGSYREPTLAMDELAKHPFYMGQKLLDPPSVEGWHEGEEWIDSGSLVERVNFAARELGNVTNTGVQDIIERLATQSDLPLSPEEVVDSCLNLMGPINVSGETHTALTNHVAIKGDLDLEDHRTGDNSERRIAEVLSLITSTPEFQLA